MAIPTQTLNRQGFPSARKSRGTLIVRRVRVDTVTDPESKASGLCHDHLQYGIDPVTLTWDVGVPLVFLEEMKDSIVIYLHGGEIDELNEVGGPGVPHPTRLCSYPGSRGVLDGDFVRRLHLQPWWSRWIGRFINAEHRGYPNRQIEIRETWLQ